MTLPPTGSGTALETAVREALDEVRDPELDEPITGLGFVAACDVGPHGAVTVRLRVPTYFCPPNFVFMMVADAHDAIGGIPGVTSVDVGVDDHFAADEINGGVAGQKTFVATFADLAECELDRLRVDFLRKAVLAATDRVCQAVLASPSRLRPPPAVAAEVVAGRDRRGDHTRRPDPHQPTTPPTPTTRWRGPSIGSRLACSGGCRRAEVVAYHGGRRPGGLSHWPPGRTQPRPVRGVRGGDRCNGPRPPPGLGVRQWWRCGPASS